MFLDDYDVNTLKWQLNSKSVAEVTLLLNRINYKF